jgi:antirestriction protein ArdC
MKTERLDIHQAITDNIIAAIEAGAGEFRLPWQRSGVVTVLPTNSATGNAYQGINILSLWASAIERRRARLRGRALLPIPPA